jgi:hypothetical protein
MVRSCVAFHHKLPPSFDQHISLRVLHQTLARKHAHEGNKPRQHSRMNAIQFVRFFLVSDVHLLLPLLLHLLCFVVGFLLGLLDLGFGFDCRLSADAASGASGASGGGATGGGGGGAAGGGAAASTSTAATTSATVPIALLAISVATTPVNCLIAVDTS